MLGVEKKKKESKRKKKAAENYADRSKKFQNVLLFIEKAILPFHMRNSAGKRPRKNVFFNFLQNVKFYVLDFHNEYYSNLI